MSCQCHPDIHFLQNSYLPVFETKQGQTVHKTATERKIDKDANIQSYTYIYKHPDKETHAERDKIDK